MLAPFRYRGITPYLVGLLGVVLATGLRQLLHPLLGDHLSFSFHLSGGFRCRLDGRLLACDRHGDPQRPH